jgi:hypothetical protein
MSVAQKQLKAVVPSRYVLKKVMSKIFCCNIESRCKKLRITTSELAVPCQK